MTRDDIIRMAREADHGFEGKPDADGIMANSIVGIKAIERFAALVAAEKERQMLRDGWRQCAKEQRTTQYCGLLDAAVKAEREACAKVCDEVIRDRDLYLVDGDGSEEVLRCAAAIRSRGEAKP